MLEDDRCEFSGYLHCHDGHYSMLESRHAVDSRGGIKVDVKRSQCGSLGPCLS